MSKGRMAVVLAVVLVATTVWVGYAWSQDAGGGRQRFDPEQMRQRQADRMREMLGASEEEWTVLEPKLTKVTDLQRQARIGGMGFGVAGRGRGGAPGMGGPGGAPGMGGPVGPGAPAGPGGEPRELTELEQNVQALQEALQNESASADEIRTRLAAVRAARDKARAELEVAQRDLREVVTARQEAQLVMMGTLD